jgi:hypothetical protein
MTKGHLLLAGIAALAVFGLGYLTGQSAKTDSAGDASSSPSASRQAGHGDAASSTDPHSATKPKTRSANADPVPSAEKGFSRRIVAMMSAGELMVNGVAINGDTLMPDEKVKEFLDLTDEQLETMKQMGRERLQAKEQHEESITKVLKSSDNEIVFDVPGDPAFAAEEKETYIEEIRKEFGPDVAAVLQTSIGYAYREFDFPRHVRYTLTPHADRIPEDAPPEIRQMMESQRDFKLSVNQNEDGTYMTGDQGMVLPGAQSSGGSIQLHNPKPDAWAPRYHYLWEREQEK